MATILKLMANMQKTRLERKDHSFERILVCAPANKAVCHLLERYAAKLRKYCDDMGASRISSLCSANNKSKQDVLISFPLNKTVLVGVADKIRDACENEQNSGDSLRQCFYANVCVFCSDIFIYPITPLSSVYLILVSNELLCWNELTTLGNRIRRLTGSLVDSTISHVGEEMNSWIRGISKLQQCVDRRDHIDGHSHGLNNNKSYHLQKLKEGMSNLKYTFEKDLDNGASCSSSGSSILNVYESLVEISKASMNRLGNFYFKDLKKHFEDALTEMNELKCMGGSNRDGCNFDLSCINIIESLADRILELSNNPKSSKQAAKAALENADIVFSTIGSSGSNMLKCVAFTHQTRFVDQQTPNIPSDDFDEFSGNEVDHEYNSMDGDEYECSPSCNKKKEVQPVYIDSKGFTTLLVDEAGQALEAELLIPLSLGCNKLMLVGDPKQLPATIISQSAQSAQFPRSLLERLMGDFSNHSSSFSSLNKNEKPENSNNPEKKFFCFLLDTQYRMADGIVKFPNEKFYDGKLKTIEGTTGRCSTWNIKPSLSSSSSFRNQHQRIFSIMSDDKMEYRDHCFGGSLLWAHVGDDLRTSPIQNAVSTIEYEDGDSSSKSNKREAQFIVDMVKWFVDGLNPSMSSDGVVVIAMYVSAYCFLSFFLEHSSLILSMNYYLSIHK